MTPRTHFSGFSNFFSHGRTVQKERHRVTRVTLDTSNPTTFGDQAEILPVLSLLRAHPEGAIVADLATELGASVHLVERRLYSLRRQGLVTSEQLGSPPVTTWRVL